MEFLQLLFVYACSGVKEAFNDLNSSSGGKGTRAYREAQLISEGELLKRFVNHQGILAKPFELIAYEAWVQTGVFEDVDFTEEYLEYPRLGVVDLEELEAQLAVAKVHCGTGRITMDRLHTLEKDAYLRVAIRAGKASEEVLRGAHNRVLEFGDDPEFPGLYSFWEILANKYPPKMKALETLQGLPDHLRTKVTPEMLRRIWD